MRIWRDFPLLAMCVRDLLHSMFHSFMIDFISLHRLGTDFKELQAQLYMERSLVQKSLVNG
jgi:hypothetical protein